MHTSRTAHILDLRHRRRMGESYAYGDELRTSRPSPLPKGRLGGGGVSSYVNHKGLRIKDTSLQATKLSGYQAGQPLPPRLVGPYKLSCYQATKLIQPITRVCSILLVVLAGSYTLHSMGPSLAYFTDTEGSSATMSTGILTIDADGGGTYGLACNENAHIPVSVSLDTSRVGAYTVRSELVPDSEYALCEGLMVAAWQSGVKRYEGPLLDLLVEDVADTSDWELIVTSGDIATVQNGAVCTVAVVYEAFCPALGYMNGGFTDQDGIILSFTKESCGDGDGECDDPTCCGGNVDIDIINVNTDVTDITVDSTTNTGGNTIISNGGTNTIITGDTSNSVTITGGTQSNVVDIDLGCGCDSEPDCDSPCTSEEMSEVKPPSLEEGITSGEGVATDTSTDTAPTNTTPIDTRIDDIRANLDERLAGVRGR